MDSSKSGPYTEGCDGKIVGGDSGEMGYGSKLKIPSGVPSKTCMSETLEGDVLGVVIFGFVGWGALIFGCEMGELCNCGGDDGGGICCCSKKRAETKSVFVISVLIIGVPMMGFIKVNYDGGSGIGSETVDWDGWGIGKIHSEEIE